MPLTYPEVESYFKRLQFYIIANDKEKVNKSILLSSCGEEAFNLIETLLSPNSVSEMSVTYEVIEKKVIEHLKPKNILHYDRHILHTMVQKQGEGTAKFFQRLKDQANKCGFGLLKDDLILSQLIFGLESTELRAKLLAKETLTLEGAVQEALLFESVKRANPNEPVIQAIRTYDSTKQIKKISISLFLGTTNMQQ